MRVGVHAYFNFLYMIWLFTCKQCVGVNVCILTIF